LFCNLLINLSGCTDFKDFKDLKAFKVLNELIEDEGGFWENEKRPAFSKKDKPMLVDLKNLLTLTRACASLSLSLSLSL
jgi:hypothetical protein